MNKTSRCSLPYLFALAIFLGQLTTKLSADNLQDAAGRVYKRLQTNPNSIEAYRRELALEALIRYGQQKEDQAMVDTLLVLPQDSKAFYEIQAHLSSVAEALVSVQAESGMWHCLLHLPTDQSPPEVSGTAMIAGFLAIALDEKWLNSAACEKAVRKAFTTLPSFVTEEGIVLSVSPGPGPLQELGPWQVDRFPPGDEHGPFAILFAALGQAMLGD